MEEREDRELAVSQAYQIIDLLDDKAVLAELEGRISEAWVYHFEQRDEQTGKVREVWGLSKVGVDTASREMAKRGEALREVELRWEPDPKDEQFVLFTAAAERVAVTVDGKEIRLDRAFGTKRQCLFIQNRKEGITKRPDPFWFEKGSAKALRNARQRLISEEARATIIALAKKEGKVQPLQGKVVETETQARPQTEAKPQTEARPQRESKANSGRENPYETLRQEVNAWLVANGFAEYYENAPHVYNALLKVLGKKSINAKDLEERGSLENLLIDHARHAYETEKKTEPMGGI